MKRMFLLSLLLFSCTHVSKTYHEQYSHLSLPLPRTASIESEDFLVILVDAKHLDYSSITPFLQTLSKHPDDASKSGDFGHSWIYLKGTLDGQPVEIEGGHTGEFGLIQPKYFEGVMTLSDRQDPNPIRYLWAVQKDGIFQKGSGGHSPTFAAKIDLSKEALQEIVEYISKYDMKNYSIINNQCTTFVEDIARIAGLPLEVSLTMPIDSTYRNLTLWTDPKYSEITFATPDQLEKSLIFAVQEGHAELFLDWARRRYPKQTNWKATLTLFPKRLIRYLSLQ